LARYVLRYENFVLVISKNCNSEGGHCTHDGIEANRAARVSKRISAILAAALDTSGLTFKHPLADARGSVSSWFLASPIPPLLAGYRGRSPCLILWLTRQTDWITLIQPEENLHWDREGRFEAGPDPGC
jgi:hypothetical protein